MSYRRKSTKKLWSIVTLVVIIVVSLIVYKINNNDDDVNNVNNKTNNELLKGTASLTVGYDDYILAPVINYNIYKTTPKVKGLYVSAPIANKKTRLDYLIDMANTTEINSFVIDVKNDSGRITFDMDNKLSDDIKAEINYIKDIDGLMDRLYENNIYPIARIVAFKDNWASKKKPSMAIKNKDGSLWEYSRYGKSKKQTWLNPYNKEAWEYVVSIAKKAAEKGFKEIQFDYIRFESTSKLKNAYFGDIDPNKTRIDTIEEFVDYAMSELKPYNVKVSADVFGTIITSQVDAKIIGQDYLKMAEKLDVICPMVYPSHYGFGFFGIPKNKHSDLYPYETILGSMKASQKRYEEEKGKKAIVRPWLQAFTASYLRKPNYLVYDGKAIRAQIKGAYDAGLEEWLLWNAGCKYTKDGLLSE